MTTAETRPATRPAISPGAGRRLLRGTWRDTAFVAEWHQMLFVHYSIPPEKLAPQTPFVLDTRDGHAFVSLVFFSLERMRPAGTGIFGRWLCRPISDHPFLNLRTYVRGEAGPGIQFFAEWIPNPLSMKIGPRTYGLPYRFGYFSYDMEGQNGVGHVHVHDPALEADLRLAFPTRKRPLTSCTDGSVDDFLLERYVAYTSRKNTRRRFFVAHAPWQQHQPDWLRSDTTMVERAFPWFRFAEFHSVHLSPGVREVCMGWPMRLSDPTRCADKMLPGFPGQD
ncbi:MAG TPA: DUF2071 domain-containing protein [Opitutaceae bacterium]|nr:DUF2071 domain-containing protein [Opitutaceae bacterium]